MKVEQIIRRPGLSTRVPKGWRRKELELTDSARNGINDLLEPKCAKGQIVEAVIFRDGAGNPRRVEALYENNWIATWSSKGKSDDGVLEERMPPLRFRITQGAAA